MSRVLVGVKRVIDYAVKVSIKSPEFLSQLIGLGLWSCLLLEKHFDAHLSIILDFRFA